MAEITHRRVLAIALPIVVSNATIPLLTIMGVAVWSTKVPILLGSGFWKMAHEARTDFSMIMGCLFLLVAGAGAWSLDARISRRASAQG